MNIRENVIMAPYTTFKTGGPARYFCVVTSEDELVQAVTFAKERSLSILVIGGGSNLLVSDDGYKGLIIRCEIKGKDYSTHPFGGSSSLPQTPQGGIGRDLYPQAGGN